MELCERCAALNTHSSLKYEVNNTSCQYTNFSNEGDKETEDMYYKITVAVLTSLLAFVILIGNGLIIVSVIVVRKLRQPANYLIASLALADFLVAFVVLPLTIVYDILGEWVFGSTVCNIHVSFDVICCATSILNLCMISIDRYLMVTRPMTYPRQRTAKLMAFMICSAWILSCLFIFPALFGFTKNVTDDPEWISIGPTSGYKFEAINDTNVWPNISSIKSGNLETYWTNCNSTSGMWQYAVDMEREYFTTYLRFESANKSILHVQVQTISNETVNSNHSLWPGKDDALLGSPTRYIRIFANESDLKNFENVKFEVFAELIKGKNCLISQDVWFTIYSTVGSFYIPLAVMLCMYYKIYEEASRFKARHRSRSKSLSDQQHSLFSTQLPRKHEIPRSPTSSSDIQEQYDYLYSPSTEKESTLFQESIQSPNDREISTTFPEICDNQLLRTSSQEGVFISSQDDEDFEKTSKKKYSSESQMIGVNNGHSCNCTQNLKKRRISSLMSFEINGNGTPLNDNELRLTRSASWCKTLNYSSASVFQTDTSTQYANLQTERSEEFRKSDKKFCYPEIKSETKNSKRKHSNRKRGSIFAYKRKISRSGSLLSSTTKPKCKKTPRASTTSSRDRLRNAKAIRTLGIIVLVFTFCWLPFFILTFIRPFVCDNPESKDCFPLWLVRLVLWLGYLNSALNPIIYVGFSPDLREAIRFLISCKCANVDRRLAQIELRQAIEDERKESIALVSHTTTREDN